MWAGLLLVCGCRWGSRHSHNLLSLNALQAMSALLCCGPVFHPKCLDKDPSIYNIYRWLENMLRSEEPKVRRQHMIVM